MIMEEFDDLFDDNLEPSDDIIDDQIINSNDNDDFFESSSKNKTSSVIDDLLSIKGITDGKIKVIKEDQSEEEIDFYVQLTESLITFNLKSIKRSGSLCRSEKKSHTDLVGEIK